MQFAVSATKEVIYYAYLDALMKYTLTFSAWLHLHLISFDMLSCYKPKMDKKMLNTFISSINLEVPSNET